MQTPEPGAEPKDDDRDGTKPRVLASAAAAFDAALDLPEATAGAAPEAAPSPPSPPTLYPPLPDALVQRRRQMAKLVEQIARRVLEIETAHRTTVARVVELETACNVQHLHAAGHHPGARGAQAGDRRARPAGTTSRSTPSWPCARSWRATNRSWRRCTPW